MPRTSKVEPIACPPLRAITTDVLGLVKVVEARPPRPSTSSAASCPTVVDTWGPPDASRSILASSLTFHDNAPILSVARKNGLVELLNPLNGDTLASAESAKMDDDPFVGVHISRSVKVLTCTESGKACFRCLTIDESLFNLNDACPNEWNVSEAGHILCFSVDKNEMYALFGGKGVEVNVWDLSVCSKIWTAKSPRSNSLGIFTPTWFTSATFLCKDDHRKIVAGTNNHQIRLYDLSSQRRPVISVNFRNSSIRAVAEDPNGHTVYIGTGSGDLASFDMRIGKLLGCYAGKCSGSIRSIARHPELPVIASCGLDSYLRLWSTTTRELLSAVFLKQHLTSVVLDSYFSMEEPCVDTVGNQPTRQQDVTVRSDDYEEVELDDRTSRKRRRDTGQKIKLNSEVNDKENENARDRNVVISEPETKVSNNRRNACLRSTKAEQHLKKAKNVSRGRKNRSNE